jgi:hypothetical protein
MNKVKRGSLYKKNGPKDRLFVFTPNPLLVEYYKRLAAASDSQKQLLRSFKRAK